MNSFKTWDDLEIAYQEWGAESAQSPPVVLHHGFVADADANWVVTGRRRRAARRRAQGDRARREGSRALGEAARPGALRRAAHGARPRGAARRDRRARGRPRRLLDGGDRVADLRQRGERVRRLVVGGVGSGVIECGGVDRRAVSNESIIQALSARIPPTLQPPEAPPSARSRTASAPTARRLLAQASSIYRGEIALERISAPDARAGRRRRPARGQARGARRRRSRDATLQIVSGDHMQALADPRFTSVDRRVPRLSTRRAPVALR